MLAIVALVLATSGLLAVPGAPGAGALSRWCGPGELLADQPDAVAGHQIHVVYAYPSDAESRLGDFADGIVTDLEGVDAWWRREDPLRTPRFDVAAIPGCVGMGALDLTTVRLPDPTSVYEAAVEFEPLQKVAPALHAAFEPDGGTLETDSKKYLVYLDAPMRAQRSCGESPAAGAIGGASALALVYLDGPRNCYRGGGFGAGNGWSAQTAAHELVHLLSTLTDDAFPHSCPGDEIHLCDGQSDIVSPGETAVASTLGEQVLDVGRNDYYAHAGTGADVQGSLWLTHLDADRVRLSFAVTPAGGGILHSSPAGARCPPACSNEWRWGRRCVSRQPRPTATGSPRWRSSPRVCFQAVVCNFIAYPEVRVTAEMVPTVDLTIDIRGRGRVRHEQGTCFDAPCTVTVDRGKRTVLVARPADGYELATWRGGGCDDDATECRVRPSEAVDVVARFAKNRIGGARRDRYGRSHDRLHLPHVRLAASRRGREPRRGRRGRGAARSVPGPVGAGALRGRDGRHDARSGRGRPVGRARPRPIREDAAWRGGVTSTRSGSTGSRRQVWTCTARPTS